MATKVKGDNNGHNGDNNGYKKGCDALDDKSAATSCGGLQGSIYSNQEGLGFCSTSLQLREGWFLTNSSPNSPEKASKSSSSSLALCK
jgi:hypothetical protein